MNTLTTKERLNEKFSLGISPTTTIYGSPAHTGVRESYEKSIISLDNKSRPSYLEEGELSKDFSQIINSLKEMEEIATGTFFSSLTPPSDENIDSKNENTDTVDTTGNQEPSTSIEPGETPDSPSPVEPTLPKNTMSQRTPSLGASPPVTTPNDSYLPDDTTNPKSKMGRSPDFSITARICLYYINETIVNPFIEYLFTWNNETKYSEFPKKTIELQAPSSYIEDSEIESISKSPIEINTLKKKQTNKSTSSLRSLSDFNTQYPSSSANTSIKTQIMNECIEYIVDLFDLHEIFNPTLLEQMFKGFVWVQESNTVYLFFNVFNKKRSLSKIDEITPPKMYKWAILDEIVNKHYIVNKNAPILPEITTLFKENASLKTLYVSSSMNSLRKIPISHPVSLYLCEKQESEEIDTENTKIEWQNVVDVEDDYFIEKTVDYSLLGDFYYFSSDIIENSGGGSEEHPDGFLLYPGNRPDERAVTNIETGNTTKVAIEPSPWNKKKFKRYAVFLNIYNDEYAIEESYIVKDTSTVNEEQWKRYYTKTDPTNVSTIWFKDRGLQLWAVKYPNQFCISN